MRLEFAALKPPAAGDAAHTLKQALCSRVMLEAQSAKLHEQARFGPVFIPLPLKSCNHSACRRIGACPAVARCFLYLASAPSVRYPMDREQDRLMRSLSQGIEGYDMIGVKESAKKQIQQMVRRIVKKFDPDTIILFGSHARGQAGPDSDVDLLVVMPVEDSKRAKQLEIRIALHDIHIPKDIIVSRPEEFQWRKDIVGTIEYPAVREGKVLYARE